MKQTHLLLAIATLINPISVLASDKDSSRDIEEIASNGICYNDRICYFFDKVPEKVDIIRANKDDASIFSRFIIDCHKNTVDVVLSYDEAIPPRVAFEDVKNLISRVCKP